jgi:hypothetical protein
MTRKPDDSSEPKNAAKDIQGKNVEKIVSSFHSSLLARYVDMDGDVSGIFNAIKRDPDQSSS